MRVEKLHYTTGELFAEIHYNDNGEVHCETGPAYILYHKDGTVPKGAMEWRLNGNKVTEGEVKRLKFDIMFEELLDGNE